MIDIRARNFENAAGPVGATLKSVTYTVRLTYSQHEDKQAMRKRSPAAPPVTKMGRPRKTDNVVRKARGVRLDPELLERVDQAVSNGYISGVTNFSEAVEKALTLMLKRKAA